MLAFKFNPRKIDQVPELWCFSLASVDLTKWMSVTVHILL